MELERGPGESRIAPASPGTIGSAWTSPGNAGQRGDNAGNAGQRGDRAALSRRGGSVLRFDRHVRISQKRARVESGFSVVTRDADTLKLDDPVSGLSNGQRTTTYINKLLFF